MKRAPRRLEALLLGAVLVAAATAATPASATSLSFSASESVGLSLGSASDSLRGSSTASSPATRSAAGEYRLVARVELPERPGRVQLQLEPMPGQPLGRLTLELPIAAAAGLGADERISARPRPYGIEFARTATAQAFFLVLDDDWHGELAAQPVGS